MRELWKTMDWPHRRRYIKHLIWRQRRTMAYLLLAAAVAYSIVGVRNEASNRNKALGVQREQRANQILASTAVGAVNGCINNNRTLVEPLRQIITDGLQNARSTYDRLVQEGTFTQAQADRLYKQAKEQTRQSLARIKYRDCEAAASPYIRQITNPDDRRSLAVELQRQVDQEVGDRKRRDAP
jgi:hypothetical protein